MTIKDRHAKSQNRKHIEGGTRTTMEQLGGVLAQKGMLAEEAHGAVPGQKGISAFRGTASPFPSYADDPEPQTPHCTAITKKGEPCKAAPMKGAYICIGHARATVGD
jgi:hypothetical protein